LILAWSTFWSHALEPWSFFGGDLEAYTAAAQRLSSTGSPYSAAVLAGPIANTVPNVPIGYFYPPLLAQLFLPLSDVPHRLLELPWLIAQIAVGAVVFPLAAWGISSPRLVTALVIATSFPFQMALFGGNVSAWISIGIAGMLVGGPRISGALSAVMMLAKLTPAPLFLSAVTGARTRLTGLAVAGVLVVVSLIVAPRAWSDWVSVLPNVLRNEMAISSSNFSPANAMLDLGLPALGGFVEYGLAAMFGCCALLIAYRDGAPSGQALAAATGSLTFASSTLWDHYLAVLIPLVLYAWPRTDRARRLLIWGFVILSMGLWVNLNLLTGYRILITVAVAVLFGAMASDSALSRPATGLHWGR
jgi:hypothetical protein